MAFVDATGLQIKTIEEILAEVETEQKSTISAELGTDPSSPIGQINGIYATQLREVWELAQVAYNGFNPDAVEGFLQDKLCGITGTIRRAATKGTVVLDCDLDSGTTLLAGTHFAQVAGDPSNRWTPVEDYTAGSDGSQNVDFEAEFAGATSANAATITVINTTVSGWNSVNNVADAVTGLDVETNAELRLRREEELRLTGSATPDAIRADVLSDADVLQVDVLENVTDAVDANGLPPKSIEVVVYDGSPATLTNDEIAQLIWDTKPGGIATYGALSGTATDTNQGQHTVYFSRPTTVEVWIELDIKVDATTGYAGAAELKNLLVALNTSDLLQGRDVRTARLSQVAVAMAGVFDVTAVRVGTSASPVSTTNLTIGPRELARLDTGRIVVNETTEEIT